MTTNHNKPRPRRWLQFSLTALLIVTTICAILFAWWRDRTQLKHTLQQEMERAVMHRQMARQAEAMAVRARAQAEFAKAEAEMARAKAELAAQKAQAAARQTAGQND